MSAVECVVECRNELGETPVWCELSQSLYWIDIREPAIYRTRDGLTTTYRMPDLIGSFALREAGGMIVTLKNGFHTFDPATGDIALLSDPEPDRPDHRFNEGRCDRRGRFWAGTMNDVARTPTGSLYRLDLDLTVKCVLTNITIPNSLAWSPDGGTMYFADSGRQRILAYEFDADAGCVGPARLFVDARDHPGRPDGSAVDIDGCLWNAEVGGARIVRYTPQGAIERIVALPVSRATACAFGGPDLSTLFITTSRQRLSGEDLAKEPLAGAVLAVHTETQGVPEPRFAG